LDRYASEEELDLFQLATSKVTLADACTSQIMGNQIQDSSTLSSRLQGMLYRFWSNALSPNYPLIVHPAKDITLRDFRSF
jgi:type VI protein secretion system component VasK